MRAKFFKAHGYYECDHSESGRASEHTERNKSTQALTRTHTHASKCIQAHSYASTRTHTHASKRTSTQTFLEMLRSVTDHRSEEAVGAIGAQQRDDRVRQRQQALMQRCANLCKSIYEKVVLNPFTACTHRRHACACARTHALTHALKHAYKHAHMSLKALMSKEHNHNHLPAHRRQCDPAWRGHPQQRCRQLQSLARALQAPPATVPVVCSHLCIENVERE